MLFIQPRLQQLQWDLKDFEFVVECKATLHRWPVQIRNIWCTCRHGIGRRLAVWHSLVFCSKRKAAHLAEGEILVRHYGFDIRPPRPVRWTQELTKRRQKWNGGRGKNLDHEVGKSWELQKTKSCSSSQTQLFCWNKNFCIQAVMCRKKGKLVKCTDDPFWYLKLIIHYSQCWFLIICTNELSVLEL